jgi:hypothetical protein
MVVTRFRSGPGALQIRNSHRHAGNAPETKSLSIGASSSVKVAVVRWTCYGCFTLGRPDVRALSGILLYRSPQICKISMKLFEPETKRKDALRLFV